MHFLNLWGQLPLCFPSVCVPDWWDHLKSGIFEDHILKGQVYKGLGLVLALADFLTVLKPDYLKSRHFHPDFNFLQNGGHLSWFQMIRFLDFRSPFQNLDHLKTNLFLDHLKSGHVQISDPHCNTVGIWIWTIGFRKCLVIGIYTCLPFRCTIMSGSSSWS